MDALDRVIHRINTKIQDCSVAVDPLRWTPASQQLDCVVDSTVDQWRVRLTACVRAER